MNIDTLTSRNQAIARHGRECLAQFPPPVQLCTNGRLTSLLTAAGTGFLELDGQSVTRWKPDLTADSLGSFFYLRDLETLDYWSPTWQPTARSLEQYEFAVDVGTAAIVSRNQMISASMEVCVHPEFDVELRRITLTNHSQVTRSIELTSYAELVMQDATADRAHPAFSKIFVQTERTDGGVLLARRRPRGTNDRTLSACHFVVSEEEGFGKIEFETDRNRFIGRGRSLRAPWALESSQPLSGTVGSVLDPIFSLRTVVILRPTESASVIFGIGAGYHHEKLFETAVQLADVSQCRKVFEQVGNSATERLHQAGIKTEDLDSLLKRAAYQVYGLTPKTLGSVNSEPGSNGSAHPDDQTIARFLKLNNIKSPIPRAEPFAERVSTLVPAAKQQDSPRPSIRRDGEASSKESLQFYNGFGGFTPDGREYVINLQPNGKGGLNLPPVPWNNVICNEVIGFIATEFGSGNTWATNSRLNRLSPWQNDPVMDPHSEALYLRDATTGDFWSLAPGPCPQNAAYQVRHGWGYTTFEHSRGDLLQRVTQFAAPEEPVKITQIHLTNRGASPQKLVFYGYVQWELGEGLHFNYLATRTEIDSAQRAVFAKNSERVEFSSATAFVALANAPGECSFTADRTEFLGLHGTVSQPVAVAEGEPLSGHAEAGLDPCAALRTEIEIQPGQTMEMTVLLGEVASPAEAHAIIAKYASPHEVAAALCEVQAKWANLNDRLQITTPSPEIDLMINGWLPYQNISCRLWGRTSAQQSGGAYGFRDQLQDSSSLIFHCPEVTRQQILRNAAHQFVEGDVLHWWHPPLSKGIRTNFADDLLWMPLVACEYVTATGDSSLWKEQIRFLTSQPVPQGEPEIYLIPSESGEFGSLYEHCCRALDRGLTRGRNGLPLFGSGDWNDGMNRVGQGGTGESVWMGFFIDYVLERMLPVCAEHGDHERVERYGAYREQLRIALDDAGWDGKWYRRGYFDDGTPLGTSTAEECRIDALVQAWAVLSRACSPERASQAVGYANDLLVDEQAGIIRLLTPPFDKMPQDPGYIKGYLPGIRENGGQYTHGVLWLIRALAELGQGDRACQLLTMLSPVSHGNSPQAVNTYKAEPYVVAADVYGHPPHVGRAGWSWYTGSAGWMFRVAVESILGIHLEQGNSLRIDPTIASDWPECQVRYQVDDSGTTYVIDIRNPHKNQCGVKHATVDHQPAAVEADGARIPLVRDGKSHRVVIEL